jgi:S-methylmethionine transporter
MVSIAGFAVVAVWISIVASQLSFRRRLVRGGGDAGALSYHAPAFPVVPVLAIVLLVASLVGVALDPEQQASLWFGIPFTLACLAYYRIRHGAGVFRPHNDPVQDAAQGVGAAPERVDTGNV